MIFVLFSVWKIIFYGFYSSVRASYVRHLREMFPFYPTPTGAWSLSEITWKVAQGWRKKIIFTRRPMTRCALQTRKTHPVENDDEVRTRKLTKNKLGPNLDIYWYSRLQPIAVLMNLYNHEFLAIYLWNLLSFFYLINDLTHNKGHSLLTPRLSPCGFAVL